MDNFKELDLNNIEVKELNKTLQKRDGNNFNHFKVINPMGAHAVATGLDGEVEVKIDGHVGYYCGGMNQNSEITIYGNAGVGVAENMMSGKVIVKGDASQSAGATGHGGLLVIEGNASARCGISMKGIDIVVKGSVGHNSAFMAQSGNLVICGNAEDGLGDSIYETSIFIKGELGNLGADCVEKEMKKEHFERLEKLLKRANVKDDPKNFKRLGSARKLYNFDVKNSDNY